MRVAVMICASLVNTQTDTRTDSYWPVTLLPQTAEVKKTNRWL